MESTDEIKCDIEEKKLFIKLLKKKAFPWTLMLKDGYRFGYGLGKKNDGFISNVWEDLIGNRYSPDNKYDFQKRAFFKQEIESRRMMRNEYHKMTKMGHNKTTNLYWNLCTPECDCEIRKTVWKYL